MLARIILSVYILYSIFNILFFPNPAFAQTPASVIARPQSGAAISKTDSTATPLNDSENSTNSQPLPDYVSPQSPTYSNLMIFNFMHGVSCIAVGQSPIGPCVEYQMQKDIQGKMQTTPVLSSINTSGGLLGSIGSVLTAMYTYKPINSGEFFIGLGQDMGIVSEAHAQVGGSGNGVLSPIFKLWETSRNFAYLILIIIFLVIGLMVMFRNKVNPQTIITVQAALPGLIIGLILITFSYFLASLITDVAFLATNIVGYYFSIVQGNPPQNLLADISNQNVLTLNSRFVGIINNGHITRIVDIIFNSVNAETQIFLRFAAGVMAFQQGNMIGHVVPVVGDLAGIVTGLVAAGAAAAATPTVLGMVLSWIAKIILIYSMFKLLLRLIQNYLSIVFLTITGPFQFLFASLPGRQGIATDWMRNMLCNVLAFPAVLAVLYFVAYLVNHNETPFLISRPAQLISGATVPLMGGLENDIVNVLLAFGALMALPAIPDIICRAVGKVGQAGQLLGQEVSGNLRGGQGYNNQINQAGQQAWSKIGQDYNTFRGTEPGYHPSNVSIFGRKLADTKIFGKTPFSPKRAN